MLKEVLRDSKLGYAEKGEWELLDLFQVTFLNRKIFSGSLKRNPKVFMRKGFRDRLNKSIEYKPRLKYKQTKKFYRNKKP